MTSQLIQLPPARIAMAIVPLLLAGCHAANPRSDATDPAPPIAGLANPASVACADQHGTLEIRKDAKGNEYGMCHLPDGRICEEWALFRDKTCVDPDKAG